MRCENCGVAISQGTRCTDCGAEWLQKVVAKVRYDPWSIVVRQDGSRWYLQVRDENGTCNVTAGPKPWGARKWLLSNHMTETEVVKTALKAVLSAVEHEALENFKYDGQTIFDPHIRVEDLVRLRSSTPLDARLDPA